MMIRIRKGAIGDIHGPDILYIPGGGVILSQDTRFALGSESRDRAAVE
jgi:hypothetical protein